MAYTDVFRLSSHAVITDAEDRVLLLRANYGAYSWGLPGGALDPGETIHEALIRECREELGCEVELRYLSGVYYHSAHNSQACVFRCHLRAGSNIVLSEEHSAHAYTAIDELSAIQQQRVLDCLNYDGATTSAKF